MLMSQFLQSRKTVRSYKTKAIRTEGMIEIRRILDEENEKMRAYGAELLFLEDGEDVVRLLEGKGGYSGVMIESPSYIALNIKEEKEEAYIYGAYYLEDLTTKLYDLNLGSCWVSLGGVPADLKRNIHVEPGSVEYLLAIGYPVAQLGIGEIPFSSRLGVEEIVRDKEGKGLTMEELAQRGLDDLFYYVRFAPSAYNNQPWRFVVEDGKVTLLIQDYKDKVTLVDAGIMIYYFEKMLAGTGIVSKFTVHVEDKGADKIIGTIAI